MMDDYVRRGALRRIQVIRQDVPEDVQQDIRQPDAPDQAIPANLKPDKPQAKQPPAPEQRRGGFTINVDEEAADWIKAVRDAGGGLTIGPEDGVIAIPDGGPRPKGFKDSLLSPEPEPEPEEDIFPKSLDELREMGRQTLENPLGDENEDELESAIQRTMLTIKSYLAKVEQSIWRRKHE